MNENNCKVCGKEYKRGAKYCPACGTKIENGITEISVSGNINSNQQEEIQAQIKKNKIVQIKAGVNLIFYTIANVLLLIFITVIDILINLYVFDKIYQPILFDEKFVTVNGVLIKMHNFNSLFAAVILGILFCIAILLIIFTNHKRKREIFKLFSISCLICGAFVMLLQYTSIGNYVVFFAAEMELIVGAVFLLFYSIATRITNMKDIEVSL